MRRKIGWLALPLVLGALMFAAKPRVEHQTLTKEDAQVRQLMSQASAVTFSYGRRGQEGMNQTLSKSEFAPLVENFYTTPYDPNRPSICDPQNGVVALQFSLPPHKAYPRRKKDENNVMIKMAVAEGDGQVSVSYPGAIPNGGNFNSFTVKRWMNLLLANPRIGPELRKRMKP